MTKVDSTDPKLIASHQAMNTAIQSVEHLLQWLDSSGRRWLVFNGHDLIKAMKFPEGHEVLMMIVAAYRDYRRTIPTGGVESMKNPDTGVVVDVPTMKDELLETEELDRAIRYLAAQMYERNPEWSLESDPL